MKITDILTSNKILIKADAQDQKEAMDLLAAVQFSSGAISDLEVYKKALWDREAKGTTSVGMGLAVPHAKSDAVKSVSLAAATLTHGVDCKSRDGTLADLWFMIAAPVGSDDHLDALAQLMGLLMDQELAAKLRAADNPDDFITLIDEAEKIKEARDREEEEEAAKRMAAKKAQKAEEEKRLAQEAAQTSDTSGPSAKGGHPTGQGAGEVYRILAVTACPTGIAHTYMASAALQQAGVKLHVPIKVETNGASGIDHPLSEEDIAAAEAIIVAADKKVETARFNGKRVLFTKVADGIHKPEELINTALKGDVPVYSEQKGAGSAIGTGESADEATDSLVRTLYKALMNGVSHMLPFVIGGGILIALAFLFDDYSINPSSFGSNKPFPRILNSIGGTAFSMMLPILAGFIAMGLADRPGLAPGVVGGILAKEGVSFTSLLSGSPPVSGGFLAALLAGFIAGYAVLAIKKITDPLPKSLSGIKPVFFFPLFGTLVVGLIMLSINPVMGLLNSLLTSGLTSMGSSSKILLGCLLAGMMSTDMGGPFNKAAYVFGTASIASGNTDIMAAVMIGGMTPPISIALGTTFFKNKFTELERRSGPVNYIMGLCFITEGAIPYAASDPLRVIPSCIAGSALAGGLSMAWGCTLMAPHGGIFVFPVVGKPLLYLLALILGSVLGMILLAILKPTLTAAKSAAE
ncbi:MAG: fructose-specific PTS transporter subunit EIIC [Deltaproteobacteria bacterium]|jgi:PTS system fructose-specific IIC component|nr:fructose-specific PTS transporter subunit EIIC [Deltaproteobacteria bacterium]